MKELRSVNLMTEMTVLELRICLDNLLFTIFGHLKIGYWDFSYNIYDTCMDDNKTWAAKTQKACQKFNKK